MTKYTVDKNYGSMGDGMTNNYYGVYEPPPPGHPDARICPQCRQLAWRRTKECKLCGMDMFEHDRREMVRRQTEFCQWWGSILFGVALLCFVVSREVSFIPDDIAKWIGGASAVFFMLGALLFMGIPKNKDGGD